MEFLLSKEKRIKKLKRRLRNLRKLRRKARALSPVLKNGYEALEPDIIKALGKEKSSLKESFNTAAHRYDENLRFLERLENHIAILEDRIEKEDEKTKNA